MPTAPKKVNKLSNLRVAEISVVDNPACPGADVLLTKSRNTPGAFANSMLDAAVAIQKASSGLTLTQALTKLALTDATVNKSAGADAPVMLRALEIQGANPQMPFQKCLATAHTEEGAKSYAAR